MAEADLDICVNKAGEVFNVAMEMLNDLSGWEEVEANPELTIYKRPTESGFIAIKVDGYIDKPCQRVAEYVFANWPELGLTFGKMDKVEYVRTFSDGSKIRYDKSHSIGPVSARECWVYTSLQQINENTWGILDTTTPLDYQGDPACVRGDLKFRIQVYAPVAGDANKTHLSVSQIIDPKGNVPNIIISRISSEEGDFWKATINKLGNTQI